MKNGSEHSYVQAGDWLVNAARRNPEAFLVMAAGAALLLRGAGRARSTAPIGDYRGPSMDVYQEGDYEEPPRQGRGRLGAVRDTVSGAAETAGEYASDIRDRAADITGRVAETASAYASTVSDYADAGRRRVTREAYRAGRKAYRAGNQAGQMLHEQPIAVAALGLAAGAAMAALLPRLEVEERAFGPARDALADVAGRAVESAKDAVGEAGKRLRENADLGKEVLKDAARGAAASFSEDMAKKTDDTFKTPRAGSFGGST